MATAAGVLAGAGSAFAQDRQKQVLVLYATRRDAQIVVVGDRQLPGLIEAGLPEGLDYYSEFIDSSRFRSEAYEAGFREFLRVKYIDRTFDLVIAMGDMPFQFLERNRDVLFTGT